MMPTHTTTTTMISIDPWLSTLARWLPLRQAIHVGAPPPAICNTVLQGVPLLVLQTDAAKEALVQRQLPQIELQFATQLIAEHTGPAQWHQASNPAESGLVPPEQLRPYWQNLKTLATQTLPATSLDDALAAHQAQPSWLWVDCFPALALLRGAPNALVHANVVIARVIIDAANAPTDTDLPALQIHMQQFGFVLAGVQPERHPAIGTALFFRDFAQIATTQLAELNASKKAKDEQSKQLLDNTEKAHASAVKIEATEAEKTQLVAERDEQAKAKTEALAQRDAEAELKTEALAARDAEAKAKQEAITARDAQAKLATERQAALEASNKVKDEQAKQLFALTEQAQATASKLTATEADKAQLAAERDAQAKAKTEALSQRDAEAKAKTEALAARDAEAKAKQETVTARDSQAKLASERQAALEAASKTKDEQSKQLVALTNQAQEAAKKLAVLESAKAQFESEKAALNKHHEQLVAELRAQGAEHETRQQMLQQELYRAEIQIDLIKDLLLREPGL
jgi:chemotaxis protein histidine kinase CheA